MFATRLCLGRAASATVIDVIEIGAFYAIHYGKFDMHLTLVKHQMMNRYIVNYYQTAIDCVILDNGRLLNVRDYD